MQKGLSVPLVEDYKAVVILIFVLVQGHTLLTSFLEILLLL